MEQWYLAAGDFGFLWAEQIRALSWLPQVYRPDMELGMSRLMILWFGYPFNLIFKILDSVGLSWWEIEKLLWFSVLFIGIYSSYHLAKYILKTRLSSGIASFIYIANTYFLLLFGGRQLGVALAYSLSPLILLKFIQFIDIQIDSKESIKYLVSSIKYGIQNGLWLAVLVCFDIRLAYLIIGAALLYHVLRIANNGFKKNNLQCEIRKSIICIVYTFVIPLFVAIMVHLFWILPVIMVRTGVPFVGEDFTNAGMLQFLSVADFSHAISLLHPNWPENLFGKVYFLQPELLILPILAYGALLFFNKTNKTDRTNTTKIIFFALLALSGAFLAKGTHEPFGGVFVWLFEHIPGFVMFRDPTKFYLYIAIGYSILIPYALKSLAATSGIWYPVSGIWYKIKNENFILNTCLAGRQAKYVILYTIFLCFWCFTIRAAVTGQMAGNFRPLMLTHEYVALKDMLVSDSKPYRTLWIPRADKFMYSSDIHPVLTGDTLWKNASIGALLTIIQSSDFSKIVKAGGVRYIIVPQDLEKRIFLSDYQFDQGQRNALIEAMSKTGLPRLPEFQALAIFENPTYTFKTDIPEYVEKQEYWAHVGLLISGSILILLTGLVCVYSRKTR